MLARTACRGKKILIFYTFPDKTLSLQYFGTLKTENTCPKCTRPWRGQMELVHDYCMQAHTCDEIPHRNSGFAHVGFNHRHRSVTRFTFRHLFLQTGPFSEHVFDESTDCRTVCNVIYTIYISHLFLQKLLHRW